MFIFQPTQPHIDGATERSQNVSLNPYIHSLAKIIFIHSFSLPFLNQEYINVYLNLVCIYYNTVLLIWKMKAMFQMQRANGAPQGTGFQRWQRNKEIL